MAKKLTWNPKYGWKDEPCKSTLNADTDRHALNLIEGYFCRKMLAHGLLSARR